MRYIIMGLAVLTVFGCGSVDALHSDDGGAGVGGQAGAGTGGEAGGQAGAAGAGVDAAAGSIGQDATADAGCIPTACAFCANGVAVPMADGTHCAPPVLDSTNTAIMNYQCSAGTCTVVVACCPYSEAIVIGDPATSTSYAECGGSIMQPDGTNPGAQGVSCPSADACVKKPGQQSCSR